MKTSAPLPAAALSVAGGMLEVEIRGLMRSLCYTPCAASEAIAWVESHGTAAGCPSVEPEDLDAVNALVARHTGNAESDPADWPAWTDDHRWVPTDPTPLPSAEDAAWWASESARTDA